MIKKRKFLLIIFSILMLVSAFTGCAKEKSAEFNSENDITVVARDAASGTRGAFHEIMKIKVKENGAEGAAQRWYLPGSFREFGGALLSIILLVLLLIVAVQTFNTSSAAPTAIEVGDQVIILSYGLYSEQELESCRPKIILVDDRNKIYKIK